MKVFVLIFSDRDIRPRTDVMTAKVFAKRDDAYAAMENDIASAIECAQVCAGEINRYSDCAISSDGRFAWKVEERIVWQTVQ